MERTTNCISSFATKTPRQVYMKKNMLRGQIGGAHAGIRKRELRALRGSDLLWLGCKAAILTVVEMNGNWEIRVTH